MKERFNITLKMKLIGSFVLLLLVPSLTIGITSYQNAKQKMTKEILVNAEDTITFLNNTIDLLMAPKIHQLTYFANTIQAGEDGMSGGVPIDKQLKSYHEMSNDVSLAYVGTEKGSFLMSANKSMADDYDPRKRGWYKGAMSKKESFFISDPYIDAVTGKMVVTMSKRLADGTGVIGIDLDLDKLRSIAERFKVGDQGFVFIVDKRGKMITHPTLKNGAEAKGSQYDSLYEKESGAYDYIENSAIKHTMYETNELTSWKLAGTMMYEEIDQEVQPIFQTTLLVVTISLLVGGVLIVLIIISIMKPLRSLMNAVEKISKGDLTERINIHSNDEIGQLGVRFNQMVDSLAELVIGIRQMVEHLASSSEELSASSLQTSQAADHVASSVQDVASSTELQVKNIMESEQAIGDFSIAVQQISNNSQQVATAATVSSELAEQGSEALGTAVMQMNKIHQTISQVSSVITDLGTSSQQISGIVEDITTIASQTNLLSLNAAIEAARAGENGRGFAVVAAEVRKLAEQSAGSAAKITALIATIQGETSQAVSSIELGAKEVATGMDVVQFAEISFDKIKYSIQDVTSQIQEVSAASQQMSVSTEQLQNNSLQIKEASVETAASAESISGASEQQMAAMQEITAAAGVLASMAEELQGMVNKFRL
ncbi:HAMP domain-containing protein [Paenibacillus sp. GSMTC-2017]|uniref:methyl-accepting chemotaxis protein n=1 Tax=Paenibacillus sp. GSMTC-2017 TaxID=2794350 RepID=UPI0018D62520|nr:methyl-accepting chemotaxis protein [Paenibacillus sp. GSMTC-2017]MBH5319623.1 HAMP domain-containing protein [Paenibacillus sp. GSMTC-2017]